MRTFSVSLKSRLKNLDYFIIFSALGMTLLSLLVLYGGSNVMGTRRLQIQCVASLVGIFLMIGISFLDYDLWIKHFEIPIFILALIMMAMVLVFGKDNQGNAAWIEIPGIGVDLQPSEFVKILFIITFSRHIDRVKKNINSIKNVFFLLIHAGIIIGLVVLTGDVGSALIFAGITAIMLFAAGLSIWYFIIGLSIVVIALPIIWPHLPTYQQMRIIVGFNPELDPIKWGYQPLLSRSAIAAGGLAGAGLYGGTVYTTLPAKHSDFIFAVLSEKFGIIGGLTYIILMSIMVIRLLYLARKARKDYGALILAGLAGLFIIQTLENIGMCLGMLPVIGITLPFMSYGGSSMLAVYIYIGVALSIASHNKKYYFEREAA